MTPASHRIRPRTVTPQDYDHISIRGNVIRLNRMPLEVPPGAVLCYLGRTSSGRPVILCPVDKLNSIPKAFAHRVQGVMTIDGQLWGQRLLITENGKVYAIMDE